MFVPQPGSETLSILGIHTAHVHVTNLRMLQQRSRLDQHVIQWLRAACHVGEIKSVRTMLHNIIAGELLGLEAVVARFTCIRRLFTSHLAEWLAANKSGALPLCCKRL